MLYAPGETMYGVRCPYKRLRRRAFIPLSLFVIRMTLFIQYPKGTLDVKMRNESIPSSDLPLNCGEDWVNMPIVVSVAHSSTAYAMNTCAKKRSVSSCKILGNPSITSWTPAAPRRMRLLRMLEDQRVLRAIDWQARSITGEGFSRYYRSGTSGLGFCCVSNEQLPCAWGAIKALLALARIPHGRRAPHVERAIQQGAAFLFSCDPATAAYPAGWGNVKPSPSWFKLGFPLGYVADILQNITVLCELGFAKDARLKGAVEWLLSIQEPSGRWRNQSASTGKTWVEIDKQGQLSKWVTLRACSVLKAVYG